MIVRSETFPPITPYSEKRLVIKGRVLWAIAEEQATDEQPAGMGIAFLFENEAERSAMQEQVEALMKEKLGTDLYDQLMLASQKRRNPLDPPE